MSGFGVRLRTFRMKKGLSLQLLADKVGATKAHIWEMEQGRSQNPSLTLLTALARALDVPIKELVGEVETTTDQDPPQLAPLFRDLRHLDPKDLDLIRTMTEQLRQRAKDGKSDG